MMTHRVPLRADHVGSLMRPETLRAAREGWMAGKVGAGELKAEEDARIREVVAMQERVGLQAVTDGEFRRVSWREGFFENVEGFSRERDEADFEFRMFDGSVRKATPVPRVVAKLERRSGIATGEFAFLKSICARTAKVTLPAPAVMHFFRGAAMLEAAVYADVPAYMADVSRIYREELADLGRLGCTYVQFDDVALPLMCDPAVRARVASRGEDPDAVIDLYIEALNQAVRGRPAGMSVAAHLCRGNHGDGMGGGGYEPVAEKIFNRLEVDGFLLEYDTPRAGDFSPLRFVPKRKRVALGLVSTKRAEIEDQDFLRRRIDEAARVVPLDQLALCPQCGFASGFRYDRMTIETEERKLENLVRTADAVWGGA